MRARVREDLQDTDAQNYRWTDDEVNGAIERAVREFSLRYPLQQQTDVPTTEDSNEIDISSLEKLLKVYSVEFPIGQEPPCYQEFALWQSTIHMEDGGNGDDARIKWGQLHTLDAESSTIPQQFDEVIVRSATGYLATIAGRDATVNFLEWGGERLSQYGKEPSKARLKSKMRWNLDMPNEISKRPGSRP